MTDLPGLAHARAIAVRACALLVGLAASGCGVYSVEGGLPSHVRTVGVEFFENSTTEAGVEERLSRAISDQLVTRSQVRYAPFSGADAIVRGSVTRVSEEPLTFSGTQVSRYRVTVLVDASVWDRARRRNLWEREGIQGQGQYDATAGGAGRDAAYAAAIQEAARQVVDGFLSGW